MARKLIFTSHFCFYRTAKFLEKLMVRLMLSLEKKAFMEYNEGEELLGIMEN